MTTAPRTVDDVDWEHWAFSEEAVLCFVRDHGRVMLIRKKRGLGAGKINAPGGRIDKGETAIEAAVRETVEETHVTPADLRIAAELDFIFVDGYSLRGWVYLASSHTGTPAVTDEADPFWCDEHAIDYEQIWADDRHWLPRVLAGESVRGRFIFDNDAMLSMRVDTIRGEELSARSIRLVAGAAVHTGAL